MRSSQDEIFHLILAIKSIRYLSCIFKVFFLILLLMHISKVSICTHAKQSHLDDNKLLTKNTTRREIGGVEVIAHCVQREGDIAGLRVCGEEGDSSKILSGWWWYAAVHAFSPSCPAIISDEGWLVARMAGPHCSLLVQALRKS